jgi:hypothetical protein
MEYMFYEIFPPNRKTYGSAKIPGVSSCDEAQPAPELFEIWPWGQSANKPSQTPIQVASLQNGSFPTVSAALLEDGDTRTNETAVVPKEATFLHKSRRDMIELSDIEVNARP